jgi:hypothetical protein
LECTASDKEKEGGKQKPPQFVVFSKGLWTYGSQTGWKTAGKFGMNSEAVEILERLL